MRNLFEIFSKYPELVSYLKNKNINNYEDLSLDGFKEILKILQIKDSEIILNFINNKNNSSINTFKKPDVFEVKSTVINLDHITTENNDEVLSEKNLIVNERVLKLINLLDLNYEISKKNHNLEVMEILYNIAEFLYSKSTSSNEIYNYLCVFYKIKSLNRKNFEALLKKYFKMKKTKVIELKKIYKPVMLYYSSDQNILDDIKLNYIDIYNSLKKNILESSINEIRNIIQYKLNQNLESFIIKLESYNYLDNFIDKVQQIYSKSSQLEAELREKYFLIECVINHKIINSIDLLNQLRIDVNGHNPDIIVERVINQKLTSTQRPFLESYPTEYNILFFLDNHDVFLDLTKLLNFLKIKIENRLTFYIDLIFNKSHHEFDNRDFDLILGRSKNPPIKLNTLANRYGLSRERARQIEKKYIDKLNNDFHSNEFNEIVQSIKLISKNVLYITKNELLERLGAHGEILYYLIKKGDYFLSEDSIDVVFLSDNAWYEQLSLRIQELPDQMTEEELDKWIKETILYFEDLKVIVSKAVIEMSINNTFINKGSYFTKSKMTEVKKFEIVLSKYFLEGIHWYNENEIMYLREKYYLEFKDKSIFEKSDRAISGTLSRFAYLVGKGKANLKDRVITKDIRILEEIKSYIENSSHEIIFITGLYNIFEDKLHSIGIYNRYHFQSNFKFYFETNFYFKKDYIYKNKDTYNIANEIYEFIYNVDRPISIEEIMNHFQHLSSNVTYNHLIKNDQIIQVGFNQYTTTDKVLLELSDTTALKKFIENHLNSNDFISTDKLLLNLQLHLPELLEKYEIQDKHNLYAYIINNLHSDFSFKRPFIFRLYTKPKNREDILRAFIEMYSEITISQIKDFASEKLVKIYDMFGLIKSLFPNYIWIDSDTLKINDLIINERSIVEIDNVLEKILIHNRIINLSKMNFSYLPKLKNSWNKYLLFSIIEVYLNDKYIIETTNNQYNLLEFNLRKA